MSIIRGAIGIALVIGLAYAAVQLFRFPFVLFLWAIAARLVLSTTVGLIAGVIPARNAAQLDPIAALRSD